MEFLDTMIKFAKTVVWVSIAVFVASCTIGAIDGPDVDVNADLVDLVEEIESVDVIELENGQRFIINRKGEE